MGRFTPGMKNFHRKGRGLGHVTFSKILYPFNISGMGEVTRLKFGKWIDYGKSHRRDEKLPMKGAWSESRDPFKNCKTPSIVLEWMKLRCLNLASKWIDYTESPTLRVKKSTRKGRGVGHVIVFGCSHVL